MKIDYFSITDKGLVREINEDFFISDEISNIFLVCDGLGGETSGDLASKIAALSTLDYLKSSGEKKFSKLDLYYDQILPQNSIKLAQAIQISNRVIFNLSNKYPNLKGMGTTICAMIIESGTAYISHVGDSRIYQIKNNKIEQITKDHSLLTELIDDNELNPKELNKFKQKNIITKALGVNFFCDLDVKIQSITDQTNFFIICTDGLWSVLSEKEIENEIKSNKEDLQKICKNLINLANFKGGPDNITVTVIKIIEPGTPSKKVQPFLDKIFTFNNREKQLIKEQDKISLLYIKKFKHLLKKTSKTNYFKFSTKLLFFLLLILLLYLLIFEPFNYTKNILNFFSKKQKFDINIVNFLPGTKVKLYSNDQTILESDTPYLQNIKKGIYKMDLIKDGYIKKTMTVSIEDKSITVDGAISLGGENQTEIYTNWIDFQISQCNNIDFFPTCVEINFNNELNRLDNNLLSQLKFFIYNHPFEVKQNIKTNSKMFIPISYGKTEMYLRMQNKTLHKKNCTIQPYQNKILID